MPTTIRFIRRRGTDKMNVYGKRILLSLSLLLLSALLLCGCAADSEQPVSLAEATPAVTPVPTPTPVPELHFPDGSVHSPDETALKLTELSHEDVKAVAGLLRQMPSLHYVNLGKEGTEENPRDLSWEDIRLLQQACPGADVQYRFCLFGKYFSTLSEEMNFHHVTMDDEGAAVREVLPCMTKCRVLDMDFTGVSSEVMAEIRDAFPEMEVIWRIWFGTDCSVRTDVERILASNLNHKLTDDNTADLKYCTKVRFLDVGHNTMLTDFSFLETMPDLEVAVLCITGMEDLTPLANHGKLEYLEINTLRDGKGIDLSPLGSCPNLEHLCACYLGPVTGWEELEKLTKLQRLWFGKYTYLPDGALEELQEALPDTVINTTNPYGSSGDWRYDGRSCNERYALLREQFDYSDYTLVSSSWYNDPMYYKEGEQRYYPSMWW